MGSAARTGDARSGAEVPWTDVLLSSIAAVSWALAGMAATAALGLHLLGADTAGSLGPMTAAMVALGAGGAVDPSGKVSAFGVQGAEAHTAIEITPLGVSLVGALLLSWFFLRSLRTAGVVVAPAELLARVGTVLVLFTGVMGLPAWAGHDVVTIDGGAPGPARLPGGAGGGGGLEIPGLGDVGDIGGSLPDRIGDLAGAKATVGFRVDAVPTLLGALGWAAGVLLVALLASRRTPLPRGWEAVHRVIRPAASALVTVLLVAVAAGLAAAAYAAIGDAHPRRIAGAALLGAPNGVWLGVPLGLFVPWDGRASGVLSRVLPDPVDDLLGSGADRPLTLTRLAELDGRVWLLALGAALLMLLAGVLTAVRLPAGGAELRATACAGRCAAGLAAVTAPALVLLGWLTGLSADASVSVLGFDAFGAALELHERWGPALLLGAVWGAGAGAAGGLLAYAAGKAGARAVTWEFAGAEGADGADDGAVKAWGAPGAGPEWPDGARRADGADGGDGIDGIDGAGEPAVAPAPYRPAEPSGPYAPRTPYRPPNPDTNPYLRVSEPRTEPEDARPAAEPGREGPERGGPEGQGPERGGPEGQGPERGGPEGQGPERGGPERAGPGADVYGAPTVVGPLAPPRKGRRSPSWPDEVPPPPPPPPAPPPRGPKRPR
ncbi:streptophobe family protein [Streptomyces sp. NPDC028635]|uniref:streptophobe family protein n=1 Tax=Streptomyces sp. NPDC028635 TaxID=3154800 RepID=UPI0033C19C41